MKCKDCKFYMDFNGTKQCPIPTINLQHLVREVEGKCEVGEEKEEFEE